MMLFYLYLLWIKRITWRISRKIVDGKLLLDMLDFIDKCIEAELSYNFIYIILNLYAAFAFY